MINKPTIQNVLNNGESILNAVFLKFGGIENLRNSIEDDLINQKTVLQKITEELDALPLYQGTPLYMQQIKKYNILKKQQELLLINEFLGMSQTPTFIKYLKILYTELKTVHRRIKPNIHNASEHIETSMLIQRFYPDKWIESSNINKLHIIHSDIVARYINYPNKPTIFIKSPNKAMWFSDAIHEYAHRIEITHPHILELENEFLDLRCGEKVIPYVNIIGESSETEIVRENDFLSQYVGKQYPNLVYKEVLSMGMEILVCGSYGGFIGVASNPTDAHMHSFIVGLLATV